MSKSVIISVKGTQINSSSETSEIELVTEGRYYKKGNAYYVTYKETEITGMDGTTTTLKIADGVVTLMRTGSTNSQLIFEQGQKHVSYYDTAGGAFTIGVYANAVNIDVNDKGGELSVDYSIEIDDNKTGDNDLHVLIREKTENDTKFIKKS